MNERNLGGLKRRVAGRGAAALVTVAALAVTLMASGCKRAESSTPAPAAAEPAMKPAPATPIEEKKEDLGGKTWDPQWDVVVEKAVPPEMLSEKAALAVKSYCPKFAEESEADKRAFWAYFFQALAGAEAGLDPTEDVSHASMARTDKVSKRPVRQEGLMQLTYEDAQRFGCDFDYAQDKSLPEKDPRRTILQPDRNLACGIRIMDKQIIEEGKPLLVKSSYWSTLQPGTASYRVFAKQMANVPPACGVGAAKTAKPTNRAAR